MYYPKATTYRHFWCFILFPFSFLTAQTDTLPVYDLLGLTVSATTTSLPINAPVARLRHADLARYDNESLLAGFNSVPGARFEQRSPGSYRISVRGSSLRAPFGVRNVKVYWNGLPLTEPGGDTFLNFLDPTNIQSLTIFKGPAGSLYGAGTGGAVLLNSAAGQVGDQVSLQIGQFGSARLAWEHRRTRGFGKYTQIRLAHQRTDGWREHSQLARTVAELGIYGKGNNGHGRSLHILATDLHYEIPGGLNPEQYEENPRQARPGSVDSRAAINYQNLLVGGRLYGPILNGTLRHETGKRTANKESGLGL
ncbi:MAG: TonB-dependent receptor [Bacteroidota bacterium]